jgi:uncharacterized protein
MTTAEELQKLQQLHASGGLTDEEYAQAKARLLNAPPSGAGGPANAIDAEQQTRLWAMLLHLSQLAGYFLVPLAGLIAPVVIWQLKKTELPGIDAHGKVVMNWILSALIYGMVCFALCFAFVGAPLFMVLGILAIVFPVIGGIKANNGELWEYPLSIPFFK